VKLQVERKPSVCSDYKVPRFCAEFSMEEEHVLTSQEKGMRVVQMKLVWGLFHTEKYRLL